MFFLNLTGPEFFMLLATLGGFIAALYLLDRAKGRKVVSTLQFWVSAGATDQREPRKRVREPWSLVLQLVSLLLLLLAISRLEWGNRTNRGRDHVILLDTSSWAAARAAGSNETVIEREREQVRRYLNALSPNDRVMLVAAASVAEPLTRFTADRAELNNALARAHAGFSALNREAVIAFATQARNWSENNAGEIVYAGPQITERDQGTSLTPDRVLAVAADRENCGIREFSVQPQPNEANTWHAFVRLKNYGERSRTLQLQMHYASTPLAPRRVAIPAGGETSVEYIFSTQAAGELVAAIDAGDSLASDDRASIFLPRNDALRVTVYTDRPEALKPLVAAGRQLRADFFPSSAYPASTAADLVVLDTMTVSSPPVAPALWINPPKERAPLPVRSSVTNAAIAWNGSGSHPLHAKTLRVADANIFETFEGDETLASVAQGAVVVIRGAARNLPKTAVIGFDPLAAPLRFEVATPLLFATLLDELSPGAFRTRTYTAGEVGLARVVLDREEQRGPVRVNNNRGESVPFTRRNNELQFFSGRPETIHVVSDEKERVFDLRLPAVAEHAWNVPDTTSGLPASSAFEPPALDFWKWLAAAAAVLLIVEWYLFGRARRLRRPALKQPQTAHKTEEELAIR